MTKILRTWTFWIKTELTDECGGYLDQFVLPELRRQIGSLRATSLFRDRSDGTTQVVVASVWESMERIRAYDGGGTSQPMIDASVRKKILDRDTVIRYYAVDSLDDATLTDLAQVEGGHIARRAAQGTPRGVTDIGDAQAWGASANQSI